MGQVRIEQEICDEHGQRAAKADADEDPPYDKASPHGASVGRGDHVPPTAASSGRGLDLHDHTAPRFGNPPGSHGRRHFEVERTIATGYRTPATLLLSGPVGTGDELVSASWSRTVR